MTRFAAAEDLQLFLGVQGTVDDAKLDQAVTLASAAVQAHCLQRLELVEDEEITIPGTWDRVLWLPERPVLAVSAVSVGGQVIDPAVYQFTRQGRLIWSPPQAYTEWGAAFSWGGPLVELVITYSHGHAVIPDEVKLATLQVAKRLFLGRSGEQLDQQIGGYTSSSNSGVAVELLDSEKRLLRNHRRVITSVEVA